MILVTGGAGFIGSNLVAALNRLGHTNVVVNDFLGCEGKWHNLRKRTLADFVSPLDLSRWLEGRKLTAVFHMGAISDTTARDGDAIIEHNFRLSLRLLDWCTQSQTPFIYASSAATYGDGVNGFVDDDEPAALQRLRPLNLYGWSKHLFDCALIERARNCLQMPPQWVGLKFFNVFGPNEYHKGEMMSLVAKRFDDAKAGLSVVLFKSHRSGITDGDQQRDFIYVDDTVEVMLWLLSHPEVSGLFNVGTGRARSFRDLVTAMFAALGCAPNIQYIDMPPSIRNTYQYFTQASMQRLQHTGCNLGFTRLEDAVRNYVVSYLDSADRYR
jgi:ADP-L-glycero-D-manno-heptose 6-epimerase